MAIGWSPREVDQHTLWELVAAMDGYNRSKGAPDPVDPMTDEEFDRMLAKSVANGK